MATLDGSALAAKQDRQLAAAAREEIRIRRDMRAVTSESNAAILHGLRDIVYMQVNQLTAVSARGELLDAKQSSHLLRLAQTYTILDSATSREQAKYDLSGESGDTLAAAEAAAHRLLGTK